MLGWLRRRLTRAGGEEVETFSPPASAFQWTPERMREAEPMPMPEEPDPEGPTPDAGPDPAGR